jgi:hypothetical protein
MNQPPEATPTIVGRDRVMTSKSPADVQTSRRPSRLIVVVFIAAMLVIGFASLYMVQMPGSFSSMLTSMLAF